MLTKAKYLAALNANPDDRRHGTTTGYGYGCRCERCREANHAYSAAKWAERKAPRKPKPEGKPKQTKDVCTLSELLKPLMDKPSIDNAEGVCAVCGRPATNKHHIVKRSAGRWVVDGREKRKPTVRLCGMGNASGCHGMAHDGRLHFRWVPAEAPSKPMKRVGSEFPPPNAGHWEFLRTKEPCDYLTALSADGWRRL